MNYEETIKYLKEHMRNRLRNKGALNKKDNAWCIRYLMDFLLCDKDKAKEIYQSVLKEVVA